jgi:hypothetical protein
MIAIALLSVMVAAGAGTILWLPASAVPAHSAGCHPVRVPSVPQRADYLCCVGRHASALTTGVFSPRPAVQAVEADATDPAFVANESDAFPTLFAPSGGPPGILILRI